MMLRRRGMMKMGKDDPYKDWVKYTFTLTSAVSQMQVIDSNTSRVPESAFALLRMAVDGVEITPARKLDFTAGTHTVYYYIEGGDWLGNYGWWYWVGRGGAVWDFPSVAHNLRGNSFVMAALNNQKMVFRGSTPPWVSSASFANYTLTRDIYVPSGSETAYAAYGFTKIHTLDEL